jgi:hypothetical protein
MAPDEGDLNTGFQTAVSLILIVATHITIPFNFKAN